MSRSDKNWKNKVHQDLIDHDIELMREGERIPVSEVEVGDHIITSWHPLTGRIARSSEVKSIVPCESGSGMHRHINKSNCYDSRSNVWVK